MRATHARQWGELNRTYGVVKGRLQANVRHAKDQRAVEINARAKGGWRDLYLQQRRDRAKFEAAERGTLSKLWSMAFLFQALRQRNPEADALTIFWVLFSSAERRAAFDGQQEADRSDFSRQIHREVAAEQRKIDTAADRDFTKLRAKLGGRRGSAGAAAACDEDRHRRPPKKRDPTPGRP